ncbi:MAG: hypothetical protein FJ104_07400, partial [Deltaproteobacteria bacterium]|nr:hypothetical protein [Deltaproteobacteria bacterium]
KLRTAGIDKIDLLFMIDNSISMADKQSVLKDAVPDLVQRLVNPTCVDRATGTRSATQPAQPSDACPEPGSVREFAPVADIHVGVISSSLGGFGSTLCSNTEFDNDFAQLIGSRPRFGSTPGIAEPVTAQGFLDWNPPAKGGSQDVGAFVATFQAMTQAVGEFGCGYEASLESVYRFLVDPEPPARVVLQPCGGGQCAVSEGRDDVLLQQRAAFLRPDSLVAAIVVSDENDCSVRASAQSYLVGAGQQLPESTAICKTNPNDECCFSCGAGTPPAGCESAAATCAEPDPNMDKLNLRCFEQKRRFGIDLLYPTQRYVNALSQPQICIGKDDLSAEDCAPADLRPNPLFAGASGSPRDPSLVFLAGIVGVPWQDLQAKSYQDREGTTVQLPPENLRYKTADVLRDDGTWDVILGNPAPDPASGAAPIPPTDNLMVESVAPRSGAALGGTAQIAPVTAGPGGNRANGHEWMNSQLDDLQYACTFPLPAPRDCAAVEQMPKPQPGCDCKSSVDPAGELNPLCQNPTSGQYGTTQYLAKAYPGLRHLQVLKDLGQNSIVASICARNVTDTSRQDYGYRPAVDAIVDRLADALTPGCLPVALPVVPDANGAPSVACTVIEARPVQNADCVPAEGRAPVRSEQQREQTFVRLREAGLCDRSGAADCAAYTVCELQQAAATCRTDEQYAGTPGWCYVDPATDPRANPGFVQSCPADNRRMIRFVNPAKQTPAADAAVFLSCEGGL